MAKETMGLGFKRERMSRFVRDGVPRSHLISLRWLGLIVGVVASVPTFAQVEVSAVEPTTTFLVVRHAERDGDADRLTKAGEKRSQLLSSLASALNVRHVYSTDTQRTKGTAQPLATAIGAEISIYGRPNENWLAALKQKHAGQAVLIVGHSNTTGVIAGLLAKTESFTIEHDEYDALFIIQVAEPDTRCLRLSYGSISPHAASAEPNQMRGVETNR